MSLDTLLEAAEFIELRSQDDRYKNLHGYAKRPLAVVGGESSETSDRENAIDGGDGKIKEFRLRNRSGKLSPIYVGPPDGFYMRRNLKGKEYAPYVSSAHNWLEKNRRAHLKECFEFLKKNIPILEDRRTSNLSILRGSLRYIQILKRKDHEFETEMRHLSQQKVVLQGRMQRLHVELQNMNVDVDLKALANVHEHDNDTNSTSTATERGTPPPSDHSEDDDDEEEAEKLVMETNPSPIPTRPLLPKPSPQKGSAIKDLLFNGVTTNPTLPVNQDYLSDKIIEAAQGLISAKNLMISNPATEPALSSTGTAILTTPPKSTVPIRPVMSQPAMMNMSVPWKGVPVTMATTVATSTVGPTVITPRTPVTQILHRSLTQKALMKQEGVVSQVTTNPVTSARFVTPSLANIPVTIAMAKPVSSTVIATSDIAINPAVAKTTVLSSSPTDWQNKLQVAGAVPLSFPYYMAASLPQFAHPILVTSLKAPTLNQTTLTTGTTNTPTAVPMAMLTTAAGKTEPSVEINFAGNTTFTTALKTEPSVEVNFAGNATMLTSAVNTEPSFEVNFAGNPTTVVSMAPTGMVASPVGIPSVVQTAATSSIQTAYPAVATSAVQPGFPLRPIFAPNLLSGQFALPLLTQTVPRPAAMVTATMVTTPSTFTSQTNVSSASSHMTTVPIVSLAQINPLGQLMSPMTVMSPGVPLASGGFTSAQLNSMIAASPYLKQFSANTIVPQSILPAGQVIGQMVKPLVVVTMPGMTSAANVPSTTVTSPIQTSVNMTSV